MDPDVVEGWVGRRLEETVIGRVGSVGDRMGWMSLGETVIGRVGSVGDQKGWNRR